MPQRPVLLLQNGVQVDPAVQRPLVQTVPQVPELQSGMVGNGVVYTLPCANTTGGMNKNTNKINSQKFFTTSAYQNYHRQSTRHEAMNFSG